MEDIIQNLEIQKFYEANSGNNKLIKALPDAFFAKYIQQEGYDDGLDYSERVNYKPGDGTYFIPGKIYTFKYVPKDKKKFDGQPVVICCAVEVDKKKGVYMRGINLNYMIPEVKAEFMDKYIKLFVDENNNQETEAMKDKTYASQDIAGALKKRSEVFKLFENACAGAYERFYIENMSMPSLIEMDDWKFLPLLLPIGFQGFSLDEAYAKYLDDVKKQNSKNR